MRFYANSENMTENTFDLFTPQTLMSALLLADNIQSAYATEFIASVDATVDEQRRWQQLRSKEDACNCLEIQKN